jgi:hypothetical protein
MADKEKQPDFNFTTSHRVSYADILEPRSYQKKGQPKGDPRYSGTFLIDPNDPDLAKLKAEVNALLIANNTSGKKLKVGRLTEEQEAKNTHVEIQVPWKSGDKEADRMKAAGKDGEVFRGLVLLKASSKYQPALAALDAGKLLEFSTPESIAVSKKYFYSGAYLVPSVGLHYYKGDAGKPDGVSLYLNAVMFAKHGPRLGGRSVNAAETFKGYIGQIKDTDPTGGASEELDDEIAF